MRYTTVHRSGGGVLPRPRTLIHPGAYNPVRIAGNAASIAVKTAFSVAGAVISTSGQVLQFTARKVTGRG